MRRVSLTNIAVGVALLVLGYSCREPGETVVLTRLAVDTVAPQEMLDLIENGALENSRLNQLIRGYESRLPREIIRTDTLILPPDTVLQLVRVSGQSITVAPLIKADSLWRPELHRFDVTGCDDGWSWSAGEFVCDRARFGHLSVYAEARGEGHPFGPLTPTAAVHAGLTWIPSYRSGWRASLGMDPRGRLIAAVVRGWSVW